MEGTMPTREDILNPDKLACTGWLRWIDRPVQDPDGIPVLGIGGTNRELVLQRFSATRDEWSDVPIVTAEQLDAAGVK